MRGEKRDQDLQLSNLNIDCSVTLLGGWLPEAGMEMGKLEVSCLYLGAVFLTSLS